MTYQPVNSPQVHHLNTCMFFWVPGEVGVRNVGVRGEVAYCILVFVAVLFPDVATCYYRLCFVYQQFYFTELLALVIRHHFYHITVLAAFFALALVGVFVFFVVEVGE